ncbi:cold-shock' DNA-binding domain-containing protein, partial [Pavlovales sp. CCMP2436]
KGFGFIAPENGGDDIFVHHSAITTDGYRCLTENEPVEYEVILADDGRSKAQVRLFSLRLT